MALTFGSRQKRPQPHSPSWLSSVTVAIIITQQAPGAVHIVAQKGDILRDE